MNLQLTNLAHGLSVGRHEAQIVVTDASNADVNAILQVFLDVSAAIAVQPTVIFGGINKVGSQFVGKCILVVSDDVYRQIESKRFTIRCSDNNVADIKLDTLSHQKCLLACVFHSLVPVTIDTSIEISLASDDKVIRIPAKAVFE